MRTFTRSLFFMLLIFVCFEAIPAQTEKKEIEVKFPEIEGWTKGDVTGAVTEQAGLIVPYNSKSGGAMAMIFINDRGPQTTPDDLSGVIEKEFTDFKDSLYRLEKMGIYEKIKEVKSDTVTLGGAGGKVKALHAAFTMKKGKTDLINEIFVFSYKNYFVKITLTQPKAGGEELKKKSENLAAALDTLFAA